MKLWFNKITKKFLVTDNSYDRPVRLFMGKVEVSLKELEKTSYNGWSELELPKKEDVILIPNKHGKSFSKFKVIYHNIKVAKRFVETGDLPVYTRHIYSFHFLNNERMYWIRNEYKNSSFPISFESANGRNLLTDFDDSTDDFNIFDDDMTTTIKDFVYGVGDYDVSSTS